MKKIDILHIYAGTSGSSGLYIDAIYKALEIEFNQEVIVSYKFPFNYGKKIFYRFSDLSTKNFTHKIDKLRLIIRYFELLYALIYSLIYIIINKPKIINYSLTTQINLEYFFLKLVSKFSKSKIWITAHDVIPFKTNYTDFDKSIKKRKMFFDLGHRIIVHNSNSINDLVSSYRINKLKILEFPFPIMDLNKIPNYQIPTIINDLLLPKKKYFLFVGHIRTEKGINILLEAWQKIVLKDDFINNTLVIAGNIPKGFDFNFNKQNVVTINRFLNDFEYRFLIENSKCVILPYTRGTNSGIPSSVVALKTKLITSDIDMFKTNSLIDQKFIFENKNIDDLISVMKLSSSESFNFDLIKPYKINFTNKILKVFSKK